MAPAWAMAGMGFCSCPRAETGAPIPAIFGERRVWNSRLTGRGKWEDLHVVQEDAGRVTVEQGHGEKPRMGSLADKDGDEKYPQLRWPGKAKKEIGWIGRNAMFNRRAVINNSLSLCSGRNVVRNLENLLSFQGSGRAVGRESGCLPEQVSRAGEENLMQAWQCLQEVRECWECRPHLLCQFATVGKKVGNHCIILSAEDSWPHQMSQL